MRVQQRVQPWMICHRWAGGSRISQRALLHRRVPDDARAFGQTRGPCVDTRFKTDTPKLPRRVITSLSFPPSIKPRLSSRLDVAAMSTSASTPAVDEYRLPLDVKPTHYDVIIKTDLEQFTFEGVVKIKCVSSSHIAVVLTCLSSLDVKTETSKVVLNTADLDLKKVYVYPFSRDAYSLTPQNEDLSIPILSRRRRFPLANHLIRYRSASHTNYPHRFLLVPRQN